MRRQRVLRASSAQGLCIFCACRLGVQVPPSQTAPLISSTARRNFNNRSGSVQQHAAASSSGDHGSVAHDNPAFTFDPNSSLSFAEQQEKARRVYWFQERQAKDQQEEQRRIWQEEEARQKAPESNARRRTQRRDGGRNGSDLMTKTFSFESSEGAVAKGKSLTQAMSAPRREAQGRGAQGNRRGQYEVFRRAKHDANRESERELDVRREREVFKEVQPKSGTTQTHSKPERGPRKKSMPSFLSSTGSATPSSQTSTIAGWGAGGTETLPVSYGTTARKIPAIQDVSQGEDDADNIQSDAQRGQSDGQEHTSESYINRKKDRILFRPQEPLGVRLSNELDTAPQDFQEENGQAESIFEEQGVSQSTFIHFEGSRPTAPQRSGEVHESNVEPPIPSTNIGSFGFYEDAQPEVSTIQPSEQVDNHGPTHANEALYPSEPVQHQNVQPWNSLPPTIPAQSTTPQDDFGIEADAESVEVVQLPSALVTPQPSRSPQPRTQPAVPMGYRTMPFDPNEFQPESRQPEVDHSANWQHLRRKTIEQPAPPPTPTQDRPQPTPQPTGSHYDDEDWVDRVFEEHRQARPYQAPPPPPVQAVKDREYRSLSDSRTSKADRQCARCGEKGHGAKDCTGPKRMKCHSCGGIGHAAWQCPTKSDRHHQAPVRSRKIFDDPFEDEQAPHRTVQNQFRSRRRSDFDDPFAAPQAEQVVTRRGRDNSNEPSANARRQRDDGTRRSNPFATQDDQSMGYNDRGRHRHDDQYDARPQREGRNNAFGTPAPSQLGAAEDNFKRQEARASRRSQKWADGDDHVESDRSSRYNKDRRERRGGRREFDEDNDEEAGAREEYRARKAARQAEETAARHAEDKVKRQTREAKKAGQTTPITLPEWTSVQQLSQLLGVRYEQFVERLERLGYDDVFPGKTLNSETSGMIAMEYNFEPTFDYEGREETERDLKAQPEPDAEDKEYLPARPPVVTIMGHVDHGKTTILDYLRKSSVAAGEAGGITQHIGAFSVPLSSSGKKVTFLDTPGHAAFLAMRQRGANVTDVVILVVAADDSVKPQTLEALKHAKAAGVPMIVAINKVDKEEADIQRCKQDLARHGVEIEDFGGETQVVCVSGKTGQGMDELEENVVTLSEILDHRADTAGVVEGWVLEATTKKAGRVATVLVRRGTLKPGCVLVAGKTWARVRTLRNEGGFAVREIGPGMPVEVDGWRDQPMAGDEVLQAESEQQATGVVEFRLEKEEREKIAQDTEAINETRRLDQERREKERAAEAAAKRVASVAREDEAISAGAPKAAEEQSGQMTVPFIIKADVSGSAEAVCDYILSVANPLIAPQILSSGVGAIHESDIDLANAASGHIIAFNLPSDPDMMALAEHRGVNVLENNIIYRVLDDVKAVMEDKLPPIVTQRVLGEAEIAMEFEIGLGGRKKLKIAGCKIRNGVIGKGARVRVTRGGEKVYEGTITSLKNVKKDVQEMRKGTECGMGFDGWEGFEPGDQIQTFMEIEEKRRL